MRVFDGRMSAWTEFCYWRKLEAKTKQLRLRDDEVDTINAFKRRSS